MGYAGKLEEKLKAQQLRSQGLSYQEIRMQIPVSKDTLSRWCKDIELSEEQKKRLLENKQLGQKKGSLVAAENKRQKRLNIIQQMQLLGKKDIGELSKRDKLLIGIVLYAAEGDKMDGKGGFTNADPQLIKFMGEWLLEYAQVPRERLRGALWIHEGLDEKKAQKYWSDLTHIPLSQFRKPYIVKVKTSSKKVRKNIHQYGVFSIRFSDSLIHRRIMGWIYGIFNDRITTHSAIAQR